jgi:hypothetical protein
VVLENFNDEIKTVDFTNVKENPKLSEKDLELKAPAGYKETTIPLGAGGPAMPEL